MGLLKKNNAKPDPEAMDQVAEALGIEISGTPKAKVATLREYFAGRLEGVPKDDWVVCPKCGEFTDDDDRIELCPFCGDEGEDEEAEEAEDQDEDEAPEEDLPDPDESMDLAELEDEDATEPEEPPTVDLDAEDEEPKALTKAEAKALGPRLDVQKKKIHEGQKSMVKGSYDIGLALREIHDSELWKAEGHPHFRAFVESMNIGTTLAYDLMEAVKKYDRKTFMDVGREKLMIVSRAPENRQKELLDKAKNGMGKRELAKEAKGGKGKAPPKEPKSKTTKDTSPEDGQITLLAKVGGRPKDFRWIDRKSGEELQEWTPESYGEVRISPEVSQFIALKMDGDKIVGYSVAFRRAEEVKAPEKANGAAKKAPAKKKTTKRKATKAATKTTKRASK